MLTARKALSLCLSVWWFRNGWNAQLAAGAAGVFAGSAWYALSPVAATPAIAKVADEKRSISSAGASSANGRPRAEDRAPVNGTDPTKKGARRRRKV